MNVKVSARRTFSSLSNHNYRKYFYGQTTSLVGTWMQMTAQSWLVFTLTHSATAIGLVVPSRRCPSSSSALTGEWSLTASTSANS